MTELVPKYDILIFNFNFNEKKFLENLYCQARTCTNELPYYIAYNAYAIQSIGSFKVTYM